MNTFTLRFAVAVLLAMIVGTVLGQQKEDRAPFQPRDGYEEARFGSSDVTIKTREGAKTLHVSLARLRVAQTAKPVTIGWPGAGLALVQHRAGTAKVLAGREEFEPLEGEWLRLPLPTEISIGTDNDTIQLDVILIEERGR
jgi:hypothetical protein